MAIRKKTETDPPASELIPEVQVFFNALQAASTAYEEALLKAEELSGEDRYEARSNARTMQREAERNAVEILRATLQHPIAKWLVENVWEDYPSHVQAVLREFRPDSTIRDLDEIARSHNWCYEYNQVRARIVASGTIPPKDYRVQMRVNGGPWQDFWEHQTDDGAVPLSKDVVNRLVSSGASFMAFDFGTDNIKIQLADGEVVNPYPVDD